MEFNLNRYKGIFFDLDGTLLNSEPLHMKAINEVLRKFNHELSVEVFNQTCLGKTDEEAFRLVIEAYPDLKKLTVKEALALKDVAFQKILRSITSKELESVLTPGLYEFFDFLKEKYPQLKLGLVSASEERTVNLLLSILQLKDRFQVILPRCKDIPNKPSPAPYLAAMKSLNLDPSECLIFEDSPTGLQAASASGAEVVKIFCHSKTGSDHKTIFSFKEMIPASFYLATNCIH